MYFIFFLVLFTGTLPATVSDTAFKASAISVEAYYFTVSIETCHRDLSIDAHHLTVSTETYLFAISIESCNVTVSIEIYHLAVSIGTCSLYP